MELEKHPDKTFIGRIERGFDFLGYHFSPEGLRVAKATIQKFVERAARLYEQEREEPDGPSLLGQYVRRWVGWAEGGLGGGLNEHDTPGHRLFTETRSLALYGRPRLPLPTQGSESHEGCW